MSFALDEHVAIVTGGSKGIGYAIATSLAKHGAHVIIVGRSDTEKLNVIAKNLSDEFKVRVIGVSGDVGETSTATRVVKIAHSEFKRLDVMVNNAGVLLDGLIGMISEKAIDQTLATNVKGVLSFTQASARLMERNGSGSIINMSSIMGRRGNRGQLVYAASKAAVIGATLSAAKELAPKGIRVNAIAPGYIHTEMTQSVDKNIDAERRASIGMGRIGQPDDVANLVLFLASDLSSYVTGQTIGVDGCMLV